jgi:acyl transferase domain-containing protein
VSWDTPIAVVGLACRFPGADDATRYWHNVVHDVYAVRPLPPERFHRDRYFHPELGAYGKSYCDLGGLVSERPFDAPAFRMSPRAVASTDVAHLWALEVARAALEDAGYDPFALTGRNVGVVVGHARGSMMTADMAFGTAIEGLVDALGDGPLLAALGTPGLADLKAEVIRRIHDRYPHRTEDGAVGSMTSALAGLISNAFGLTGRHMVVDAACASSFAALEIGARALQQGKLDACLVGGASYSQELSVIMFAQSRALSPTGTYPFDRRANGFISSDGFGLFLLRRLEDAVRDGNQIRAVIRGVGGSCDGKGRALWAPRKEGQVLAMRRAYAESGVDPATVDLIEAHATSTPLGDRTEVEALHEVYAEARRGRPIAVGSVKGNIGHAREAAGAAGLAKAILALEQATLPPTGNFREASEEIPWDQVAVEVMTAPRPWSARGVRRAGCNAFGIGGLNYHVIVEEAPPQRRVFAAGAAAPRLEQTDAPLARADIAVVGLGARLPESPSAEALFENLVAARELATVVPGERWDRRIYHQPGDRARYRTYLERGAFVRGFEANWRRYKMPPKLVERNDPLQFMLLESAMDALEQAGLDPAHLEREKVAVIMGTVFGSDYALELSLAIRAQEVAEAVADAMGRPGDEAVLQDVLQAVRARLPSINEDSSGSFSSSTLASRIAKTLDFMGPAYAIDAACASSMASVEAACELLRDGVVDLAIAGGGDRAMRVQRFEAYCQFYALTRSGQPRPFDARADGFLPGEGAGVVVLERLEDAQRHGRRILGVIRGIGASGDGERKSLYKPSADGLARAMGRAFAQAPEVRTDAVGFVECHGGATPLGDATEVAAVRAAYGPRSEPLTLGSVKSNIGHTQGAAGVAALIKAAQVLSQGTLPPTRGFEAPHPDHRFDATLRVNTEAEPYRHPAVGVSSMGLAGINYHAVLSRPPSDETMTIDSEIQLPSAVPAAARPVVVRIAAADLGALAQQVAALEPAAALQARQLGEGPAVLTLAAEGPEDVAKAQALVARAGLGEATRELREKQGVFARAHAAPSDRVALLFSGQGSQYPGMMVAYAESSPAAQDILQRVDAWLEAHALPPLGPRLRSGEPLPGSVFGVQAAVLTADLMAHAALVESGVRADVLTGHSFGDYAALVAAGAWSLEDALTATRLRANAIEGAEVSGGMSSVTAGRAEVQAALQSSGSRAEVANVNAPDQVVVAGAREDLERLEAHLSAAGVAFTRLEVPGPFHSSRMGRAKGLLQAALTRIPLAAPHTPYLSSVTGRFEGTPEGIRAALVAQLEAPVDFVSQVERLSAEGISVFVECGPRAVLAGLCRRILGSADAAVLSVDDKARPGPWALARIAAALECRAAAGPAASALPAPVGGTSHLSILEGAAAESLFSQPGFQDFWARTRPGVTALVERLWEAEQRRSAPPAAVSAPASRVDAARTSAAPARAPEAAPVSATAKASEVDAAPPRSTLSPAPSREELQAFLLDALCAESGYPPDLIDPDADLEADLGIDTVKQAQVFGKVRDKYGLRADERLALRDFPTMGHILRYVEAQLQASAARPAAPSRVAVVDLTAARGAAHTPPPVAAPPRPVNGNGHGGANGHRPPASPRAPSSAGRRPPRGQDDEAEAEPALPRAAAPVAAAEPEAAPRIALFELPEPQARLPAKAPLPVTVLHLEGTARQLGRQHGEALRDPILEVMHRYQDFVGEAGMGLLALPETTHRLHRLFDADTLEELRGLAEAVGVPYLYLLAYNLDAALFPALVPGCTQALHLAAANGGELVHMVNEDSPLLLHLSGLCPRVVQVRLRTDGPRPGRRTVLFSMAGQIAGPNGVTSDGLTITGTTLLDGPPAPALPDGLPHPQLVKQLLEGAADVQDALRLARAARRAGRWSLLISSADHDAGHYLEYDGERILADQPVRDRLSSANHATLGADPAHPAPEHSLLRHQRACALLGDGGAVTPEAAQAILRDRHDLGRGRDVTHPTMNTVRRVDNVMSLVVAPRRRRLWVSDRVVPPGAPGEASVRFLPVDYGAPVMRRHVVRASTEALPAPAPTFRPQHLLLVGEGPRASLLTTRLRARGIRVLAVADVAAAQAALREQPDLDALGLVLAPPAPHKVSELRPDAARAEAGSAWVLFESAWCERREATLQAPFQLLRAWQARGPVFAVTGLGGGLGFENAAQGHGEHGGVLGALKAVRRELGITALCLDTSPSETPEAVADALLAELDRGAPRLEVGLLRGRRVVLAMPERAAPPAAASVALPEGWVVTGGARGVTAKLALALAERGQPTLHIFGRMTLPDEATLAGWRALDAAGLEAHKQALLTELKAAPGFTPLAWRARCEELDKALEADANLAAMRAAGSEVHYYAVDLASRDEVEAALAKARAAGPLQGILHGAGVEVAKPLEKKTDALFEATVGGKVDGLVHLLHLTAQDPIGWVVGFSSVSGRFGGHGQVDYALANEALAHLLHEHRARHPERRVAAVSWAAFGEVGLAARSSARAFLEASGQAFMSPAEGAEHLLRELQAGLPEPEVCISAGMEALDLDHLLVPPAQRPAWLAAALALEGRPMLGPAIVNVPGRRRIERLLRAEEPFLADHQMGSTPILPAVMALETFLELALLDVGGGGFLPGSAMPALEAVRIHAPLKLPPGGSLLVQASLRDRELALTASHRRADGVTLEPDRLHVSGRVAAPRALRELGALELPEQDLIPYPYPDAPDPTPGSKAIYHGPTFRTLQGALPVGAHEGLAVLQAPEPSAAVGPGRGLPLLPVAVLDGCLQAVGLISRLRFELFALPAAFQRVAVFPENAAAPGELAVLRIAHQRRVEGAVVSDFVLSSRHGAWVEVTGYEAQTVPTPWAGVNVDGLTGT